MSEKIEIQAVPADIDTAGFSVEKKACYANAYYLAKHNPDTVLVEGVLVLAGDDKTGKAAAHAWNRRGGLHFDITANLWVGAEYENVSHMQYFANLVHQTDDLLLPDAFKFDATTIKDMEEINMLIGS